MKKIITASALLFFCALIPHVFAQGFVPLAPIPGLTQGATADTAGLANFFNNLYKYLIGVAAILAVIEIIWGGIEISTKDSVSAKSDGRQRIYNAIGGLALTLSPVLVFSIINPSILNLSINLPALDTAPGVSSGGSGGTTTGTQPSSPTSADAAAVAAGCTPPTGTLLRKTNCPNQQAAQNFVAACTTGAGSVSSSLFSSQYQATCPTALGSITGPYSFKDTSSGVLATITGYSKYEPLASTPTNPNNGTAVLQFASACTADSGTTCMSAVKLPCAFSTTACWSISLSCTDGSVGVGGCSSNPQFTIVQ